VSLLLFSCERGRVLLPGKHRVAFHGHVWWPKSVRFVEDKTAVLDLEAGGWNLFRQLFLEVFAEKLDLLGGKLVQHLIDNAPGASEDHVCVQDIGSEGPASKVGLQGTDDALESFNR
jgi:hypothetical protein